MFRCDTHRSALLCTNSVCNQTVWSARCVCVCMCVCGSETRFAHTKHVIKECVHIGHRLRSSMRVCLFDIEYSFGLRFLNRKHRVARMPRSKAGFMPKKFQYRCMEQRNEVPATTRTANKKYTNIETKPFVCENANNKSLLRSNFVRLLLLLWWLAAADLVSMCALSQHTAVNVGG